MRRANVIRLNEKISFLESLLSRKELGKPIIWKRIQKIREQIQKYVLSNTLL